MSTYGARAWHGELQTQEFRAQVPPWFPGRDAVVYVSGAVELGFAVALVATRGRNRVLVGLALAVFFVAVSPGNVSQYVTHQDAFGLDTDGKRLVRLFFQPLLVLWALWATGATEVFRPARRG